MDFLNDLTGLQKSRGMYFKLLIFNQFYGGKFCINLTFLPWEMRSEQIKI